MISFFFISSIFLMLFLDLFEFCFKFEPFTSSGWTPSRNIHISTSLDAKTRL